MEKEENHTKGLRRSWPRSQMGNPSSKRLMENIMGQTRLSGIKLLPVLFFLASPMVAFPQLTFTTNNNEITIIGYTGTAPFVNIPGFTNGYAVTSIGRNAFFNNQTITDVQVPDSVACIGANVFLACQNLTNVTIGSGVTNIVPGAFWINPALDSINVDPNNQSFTFSGGALYYLNGTTLFKCLESNSGNFNVPETTTTIESESFDFCTLLTNINISSSVTNIDLTTFGNDSNLRSFTVDPLNPIFLSRDGLILSKDGATLIRYPSGTNGSYLVPNYITHIGANAFIYDGITNVIIGNNVTDIQSTAFYNCYQLVSATLGRNVSYLGAQCFGFCPELVTVTFVGGISVGFLDYPFAGSDFVTFNVVTQPLISNLSALPTAHPGGFGFRVNWASGQSVVVEVCTNLGSPLWTPIQTNILTDSVLDFTDSRAVDLKSQFYRVLSP
jgi:hypothetical protein